MDKFLDECLDVENVCQTPGACRKNEVCNPNPLYNEFGNETITSIGCGCPRENGVEWIQPDPNNQSICVGSKF